MFFNEKVEMESLPVYEVKELSMEEALLVLAAEKENLKPSRWEMGSESHPRRKAEHAGRSLALA